MMPALLDAGRTGGRVSIAGVRAFPGPDNRDRPFVQQELPRAPLAWTADGPRQMRIEPDVDVLAASNDVRAVTLPYEYSGQSRLLSVLAPGQWLGAALEDLRGCQTEAEEDGNPPSTSAALRDAETVLRALARTVHTAPQVYPLLEGEVAVEFHNPNAPHGVLLVAEAEGGASCVARTGGTSAQVQATSAGDLVAQGVLGLLAEAGIQ